jgi:hypothetical protein
VSDSPKLTLVLMDPEAEWSDGGAVRAQVAEWTKQRGNSPRLYPAALVWCFRKPGRDLKDKVETWLAWKRVAGELAKGVLGDDFDKADRAEVQAKVADAEGDARDEVWASYRFAVVADTAEPDGLKVLDLGAGHASSSETLCGKILAALKSVALLNESVGAGYIERNWPPALKESGAWPLKSLRKSFLDGSLTRLLDPDTTLRKKVCELVEKGEFGYASGQTGDGYERVWFQEWLNPDEVSFEPNVFLLTKAKARTLKTKPSASPESQSSAGTSKAEGAPSVEPPAIAEAGVAKGEVAEVPASRTMKVVGTVPPELWNKLGIKLLPKLKSAGNLTAHVELVVQVKSDAAKGLENELGQLLADLGLSGQFRVE